MRHLQKAQLEAAVAALRLATAGDLPIAAYGSLPDRPEPGMIPLSPVVLPGFRKSMCVRVATCRGSAVAPGLVAGLIPDPSAAAMAMLMQAEDADDPDLLHRLAARELDGKAYAPVLLRADAPDGCSQLALAFVADVWHRDFWSGSPTAAASMISAASGDCGANRAYLDLVLAFETRVFGRVTPELAEIARRLSAPELGRQIMSDTGS